MTREVRLAALTAATAGGYELAAQLLKASHLNGCMVCAKRVRRHERLDVTCIGTYRVQGVFVISNIASDGFVYGFSGRRIPSNIASDGFVYGFSGRRIPIGHIHRKCRYQFPWVRVGVCNHDHENEKRS